MSLPWTTLWNGLAGVAEWVATFVIAAGLLQNAISIFQLGFAYHALRRRHVEARSSELYRQLSEVAMPISLLAPAFNEEATIVESVRSLLALQYPDFEVIVVNDGSKDRTLEVLTEAFGLRPVARAYESQVPHKPVLGLYGSSRHSRLLVVDKQNGGKADALNAGISVCRTPLFCAIDADSVLEPDALLRVVQPFVDDPVNTIAAGGTIRIANGCKVRAGRVVEVGLPTRLLPLLQVIEYLRAFLMARLAWSELNALILISGAFGIFRRAEAVEVGGYTLGTVGEDLEIIVKLHRLMRARKRPYRISFIPEPVCWTEAPETLAVLGRQRSRWQRGALETFFKHKDMLFGRRYGRIGIVGMGNMLLVDVIGPVVEVVGYLLVPIFWALGLLNVAYLLAFVAVTFTFGIAVSVGSLILEELELRRVTGPAGLLALLAAAVVENLGYRQLNNLWRIRGWWQFLRKSEAWGTMTRRGFATAA
jgi:cellulose synthase/poly-beta-1,6-N-acetylglucosamine synthase-like glycosyltransferase